MCIIECVTIFKLQMSSQNEVWTWISEVLLPTSFNYEYHAHGQTNMSGSLKAKHMKSITMYGVQIRQKREKKGICEYKNIK